MKIRIKQNGQIMNEQEFRSVHSNTSFPTNLSATLIEEFGGDIVYDGTQDVALTRYQHIQEGEVELVDGTYIQRYVAGPIFIDGDKSAAEQESEHQAAMDTERADIIRAMRNQKLAELDWTQGKDIPESISAPAAIKRQALRDLTNQSGFPWTITWPDAP